MKKKASNKQIESLLQKIIFENNYNLHRLLICKQLINQLIYFLIVSYDTIPIG